MIASRSRSNSLQEVSLNDSFNKGSTKSRISESGSTPAGDADADPTDPFCDIDPPYYGLLSPPVLAPIKIPLAIALVPVRFLSLLVFSALLWSFCKLMTIGVGSADKMTAPLPSWRSAPMRLAFRVYARAVLFVCFGVYWIEGTCMPCSFSSTKDEPFILVCNHQSILDFLAVIYLFCPSFIAKKEVGDVPFVGTVAKALQYILVDRTSSESRKDTLNQMKARCEDSNWPTTLLFPEGCTTNGRAVIQLQKGVFGIGKTIRPIAISYRTSALNSYSPAWPLGDALPKIFGMCSQMINRIRIDDVGLITAPDAGDDNKAYDVAFAGKVQKLLADARGAHVRYDTYKDHPEIKAAIARRAQRQARKSSMRELSSITPQSSDVEQAAE